MNLTMSGLRNNFGCLNTCLRADEHFDQSLILTAFVGTKFQTISIGSKARKDVEIELLHALEGFCFELL